MHSFPSVDDENEFKIAVQKLQTSADDSADDFAPDVSTDNGIMLDNTDAADPLALSYESLTREENSSSQSTDSSDSCKEAFELFLGVKKPLFSFLLASEGVQFYYSNRKADS